MSGPGRGQAGGRFRVAYLYEDDEIVAVDKPCGLPTIAPEGSRSKSLYDVVTDHIRKRNPKGRAAVVHRLDRDTSGVIVFAKGARAKAALMSAWNESVDERAYVALAEGRMPAAEGVLDSWLSEIDPYRVRQVPAGTSGSLRAVTRYRVLAEGDGLSLVELSLETGRRHQIRVQLAAVGCPVVGDERYGSRRDPIGRLGLHASLISLARPSDGATVRVECPAPPAFAAALSGAGQRGPSGSPDGPRRPFPDGPRKPSPGKGPRRAGAESRPARRALGAERDGEKRAERGPQARGRLEDRSRAWPGGGPSSRAEKPATGPRKSSSRYSTRTKRKP
ncbi:MAG: hypothetical protein KKA67_06450 [Spirochaetes bacterium]|nr:hypothetical protein [Spirochaetota bacterium]MBU1080131.1 hypothetical protein [Spirochaetota bacterium]